ncbi:MAG: hypothetical protein WCR74_23245, partial [Betaproteobacteria bacterium]
RHNLKISLRRNKPLRGVLWLRHNLKISLRRNKPLRGVLSRSNNQVKRFFISDLRYMGNGEK